MYHLVRANPSMVRQDLRGIGRNVTEMVGRCVACPLAAACDPGCTDARRVSDFVCAFNRVSLAHRDRFPCQPDIFDILSRPGSARRPGASLRREDEGALVGQEERLG